MSSIRDPAYITDTGQTMMTAGGDITYTKAVLYGQDISNLRTDQIKALTTIGNPLRETQMGVSGKKDTDGHTTIILEATFQNNNLKADLFYTAVGFFARKDDKEKLVAVAVANKGTYLAATSPDGVATDALDLKLAITIGDTANVTTMIDPAGSVTPAALHNAITDVKSEMKTGLDTKADKQTVTDDLVKKADKTDVDAQIGTVNKSVSDLSDTVKANKDDTDKVLATKADKATVESELSTKANQSDLDKTNAEVAKKASTTDVNSQLATKADAKDVTDALALKDDTVDVDKKISNVTNSVNSLSSTVTSNKSATDTALGTKANANDVANSFEEVRNRVKKLEGQQELTAPDFNTLTSTGIYMIENPTNGKNSPSNGSWGTLVVSRGTTGSDSRVLQEYYPDSGDLPYFRMSGPGGVWRDWKQLSDQSEINSLRDAVNTKADKTALDAYAKSADVANDVKTLQDDINAKADAQTVSDAISKIDLTPFAKTADVNSALSGKADKVTIDAINKALASKRDITDSYSRDELDKKFLQLSADTGGKVSADQVSKLIAGKADQDDVDKKIKAVTDAVNTKANSSDVTSLINSNTDKLTQAINAITYSAKERPLPSNDANEITEDGIYRVGYDPLKNGAGQQWDFLLVKKWDENTIYQMMYGGGKGIFIRNISKTSNSYPEWTRIDIDVNGLQNTLNAKANTADVNTALSKKDDITDVDAKIKTVTDLANTKANSSDVYTKSAVDTAFSQRDSRIANVTNLANQIDSTRLPLYQGSANEDLKGFFTPQIRMYNNATGVKNIPADCQYQSNFFGTLVVLPDGASNTNDGSQILITPERKAWIAQANGQGAKSWSDWSRFTLTSDLSAVQSALQAKIDAKADASNVYSKSEVDSKTTATIVTGYDIPSKTRQTMSAGVNVKWLVDPSVIDIVADQINQLKGRRTVDKPDFNTLTDGGTYYVTSPLMGKNYPTGAWGTLLVSNGSGHRISQLYFPDDSSAPWTRLLDETTWHNWIQLSTKQDVNNATNAANAASNKVDTVLGNSYVRKQGMNANGDCIEIKHTGIKQANGGYAFDIWSDDWTANKLQDVIKNQLPSKADKSQVNVSGNLFNHMTDDSTWKAITGVDNTDNAILTSIRDDSPSGGNTTGGNGSAIAFGGADTKAVLSVNWLQHEAKITSGNGSGPKWVEDVAWKSDVNNTNANVTKAQSTADSANTNANGRLSKAGDTMNTKAVIQWNGGGIDDKTGNLGGMNWSGGTDWAEIYGDQDNNDNLDLAFDLGDDGSNHFSFRKNGTETSAITSDGHYTGTVDWGHVNGRPDVATKADVNSTNATIATLSQTVQSLKDTLDSATATIKSLQSTVTSLQDTITKQATQITGLQTLVNNQANEIKQLQETTIKGKTFSKSQEAAAEAWESQNSQQIAFIRDKQ